MMLFNSDKVGVGSLPPILDPEMAWLRVRLDHPQIEARKKRKTDSQFLFQLKNKTQEI